MKVVEIKDIIRKDIPIYYRRFFSGTAVLEILNKTHERRLDFSIETKPTGQKEISVTMAEPVDYPAIPLMKDLKTYVNELDVSGKLPG